MEAAGARQGTGGLFLPRAQLLAPERSESGGPVGRGGVGGGGADRNTAASASRLPGRAPDPGPGACGALSAGRLQKQTLPEGASAHLVTVTPPSAPGRLIKAAWLAGSSDRAAGATQAPATPLWPRSPRLRRWTPREGARGARLAVKLPVLGEKTRVGFPERAHLCVSLSWRSPSRLPICDRWLHGL